MSVINKFAIWILPNGNINITSFIKSAKRPAETEDEFIERETNRIRQMNPNMATLPMFVFTKQQLKAEIANSPVNSRHSLKANQDGTLYHDTNYKTPKQLRREKMLIIKSKLTSSIPLTDEEADIVLGIKT